MFIISGEKGTGKTRALLERASAEGGTVVCKDPEAMRVRAHKYGIVGLDIKGYGDAYSAGRPVYIHDINKFIEYGLPEAAGYTLNLD